MRLTSLLRKEIFVAALLLKCMTACEYTDPIAPPGSLPDPTPVLQATLQLPATGFEPGSPVQVSFTLTKPLSEYAYVGLVPHYIPHGDEKENRNNTMEHGYLEGKTIGVLEFIAPHDVGTYNLRLNEVTGGGSELASVPFSVVEGVDQAYGSPTIRLDKTIFTPGEEMLVYYVAQPSYPENAWIGSLELAVNHGSEAESHRNVIQMQFLEGRTSGILLFNAPDKEGEYDMRMHDTDDNGQEVFHVPFEVRQR